VLQKVKKANQVKAVFKGSLVNGENLESQARLDLMAKVAFLALK
jgi:hypothetical protein